MILVTDIFEFLSKDSNEYQAEKNSTHEKVPER